MRWITKKQLRKEIERHKDNEMDYAYRLETAMEVINDKGVKIKESNSIITNQNNIINSYRKEIIRKNKVCNKLNKELIQTISDLNEARDMIKTLNKQVYLYKNREDARDYDRTKTERN